MMKKYYKQFPPQFWLLCLSTLLFFTSFNIIIPELPSYLTNLGGQDYKGFIIAIFTISAAFSRPFSGKLADQWGRVPVMIIGATFSAMAGLLYSFANGILIFLFIRFVHGFSTGFKPTGTVAYVADIIDPARRGESMAVIGLMNNFGFFIGVGCSTLIKNVIGYNGLFISSAVLALASIAVLAKMKETLKNKAPFSRKMLHINKNEIFDKRVIKPMVITLLTVSGFGAILTVIPDFSVHLGLMNKGGFLMVSTLGSLTIRFFSGKLSDRLGRKTMLLMGALIWILGLGILAFTTTVTQYYVAAFIVGVAIGINSPSFFAWAIDLSKGHKLGRAMGSLFIALEFGFFYGSLLSGELYQNNVANFKTTFLTMSLFYVCAAVLLIGWQMKETQQRNPSST